MNITVRRLRADELGAALHLCAKTYLVYEAPVYPPEGAETFQRDVVDCEAFHEDCRSGKNRMWGAFDGEALAGVVIMRGVSHISLFFIDGAYHRRGIGTALFESLLNAVKSENPEVKAITVHSSPYGAPFYHRLGFEDTGEEQLQNGIIFTPMKRVIR